MRRVLSWPSLTPGMGVFLNIYDRDKLPRFVHDSMPQPSSTLDCTPVKGLRVVDDSKALSVERRHVFHQINPTTYNSPGSAVDYPPVYPHHQPDPRELGHTSHFEGGRALITAEIFAMVRHMTVHHLFYLHRSIVYVSAPTLVRPAITSSTPRIAVTETEPSRSIGGTHVRPLARRRRLRAGPRAECKPHLYGSV